MISRNQVEQQPSYTKQDVLIMTFQRIDLMTHLSQLTLNHSQILCGGKTFRSPLHSRMMLQYLLIAYYQPLIHQRDSVTKLAKSALIIQNLLKLIKRHVVMMVVLQEQLVKQQILDIVRT